MTQDPATNLFLLFCELKKTVEGDLNEIEVSEEMREKRFFLFFDQILRM